MFNGTNLFQSRNPKKRKFAFGNYPNYCKYRYKGDEIVIDPRLKAINLCLPEGLKSYVDNQLCLDIGCNTGAFSQDLVLEYGARRVVGIDIDGGLISQAIKAIPKGYSKSFGYEIEDYSAIDATIRYSRYFAIFCMSVTKWIHLHGGDDAVKRVLRRMYLEAKVGGVVIIEPQLWETYTRKKGVSAETALNYANIRFKPDQFIPYILREFPMALLATMPADQTVSKGFQRPIYVLRKLE